MRRGTVTSLRPRRGEGDASLQKALDPHQEEALGKAYDARLIRRLWGFIHPYRRLFWLSVVCLPLNAACMLTQPYLLKRKSVV